MDCTSTITIDWYCIARSNTKSHHVRVLSWVKQMAASIMQQFRGLVTSEPKKRERSANTSVWLIPRQECGHQIVTAPHSLLLLWGMIYNHFCWIPCPIPNISHTNVSKGAMQQAAVAAVFASWQLFCSLWRHGPQLPCSWQNRNTPEDLSLEPNYL